MTAAPHGTEYERVADADLIAAVTALPADQITVTGYAGSGYSMLTYLLGPSVYAGKLPVEWSTSLLVVMRESLTDEGAEMLQRLGVPDARQLVSGLRIGEALLVRHL